MHLHLLHTHLHLVHNLMLNRDVEGNRKKFTSMKNANVAKHPDALACMTDLITSRRNISQVIKSENNNVLIYLCAQRVLKNKTKKTSR